MSRPLVALARLNVLLHVAGLVLAAAFIRPGSPLSPLDERRAYLAAWPAGWATAWAVWAACGVVMVAFTIAVAGRVRSQLARRAVSVAVAAAVIDLTCDGMFIGEFPRWAAEATASTFLHRERFTNLVSLFVANGLYSVSIFMLTLSFRRVDGMGRAIVPVGVAVAMGGLVLAVAGITGVPEHALWATGPTIGLYCIWVLLVARSLTTREALT